MRDYIYNLKEQKPTQFSVPLIAAELPKEEEKPTFLSLVSGQYGFLNALMGSAATSSLFYVEGKSRKYKNARWNCEKEGFEVDLGRTIWTELPEDIGLACCHTKPDVTGCTSTAFPMRLCLKDCYDDLRAHWKRMVRQGWNIFGGRGAEEEYWAELRAWFTFFQARDIMYGQVGVTGNNVPSFPGVLDMLNKAVVTFNGSDIIGAFEQIGCRFDFLNGDYVFGGAPLTVRSIRNQVTRGNVMYKDFSMRGEALYYRNHPIVEDINIPINMTARTGQLWVADLNVAGVFMEYDLTNPEVQTVDNYTDSNTGDCFNTCHFLKNYGFAFTKDYNRVFRVTDIPLDGACFGPNSPLYGLGGFFNPERLIIPYE